MAAVALPPASPAAEDDLDSLLPTSANIDHLFEPMIPSIDRPPASQSAPIRKRPLEDSLNLGITSELDLPTTKRRAPTAKLDENLLLSAKGIPKLRQLSRPERMRFKGKGYEFQDVEKVLKVYQFWLDEMFPKAKFGDGLVMVEKLGHGKRMGIMRREWVKEGEMGLAAKADESREKDGVGKGESTNNNGNGSNAENPLFVDNDEDLLPEDDQEDDDDLDALMAEATNASATTTKIQATTRAESHPPDDEGFEEQYSEEMKMMAEMDDEW